MLGNGTYDWGELSRGDNYYLEGSVSPGDVYEIYFSYNNSRTLYSYFDLFNFTDDLDLYLYQLDASGLEYFNIKSSEESGVEQETLFKGITAGDYVLQISHYEDLDRIGGEANFTVALDAESYYEKSVIPNDQYFDLQWHLINSGQAGGLDNEDILAPEAWNTRSTSPDVIVGVIDSGIQLDHPDLTNNIWNNSGEIHGNNFDDDGNGYVDDTNGWNFPASSPFPFPDEHGTHVAGIIGAEGNNEIGVAGVSWDVQLMPLDVFNGAEGASDEDIINAIYYAANNGANIINMSLGLTYLNASLSDFKQYESSSYSLYYDALTYAVNQGVTVVIAAGNNDLDNDTHLSIPAAYSEEIDGVISVAALNNSGDLSWYTNYGTSVTIAAPGGNLDGSVFGEIVSTFPNSAYYGISGTSMASPIVAGAAALIQAENIDFSPSDVEDILTSSADKYREREYLVEDGNYLNLDKALSAAKTFKPSQSKIFINEIVGTNNKDTIKGTKFNDFIDGKGGADKIKGNKGDDLIDPGEWTKGKFDKVKGGAGADTFVIKDGYWALIKDFKLVEDNLDIKGISKGLDWKIDGKQTYIYGEDGYEVARFKGKIDLSEAKLV